MSEGGDFPYLGIVWEGVLAISTTNAGRARTFYEVFPFEIFGDVELFDHGLSMGRIAAREPRNTPSTIRSSRRSNDCRTMVARDLTGEGPAASGHLRVVPA